jgi:hypothetical protein
MRSPPSMRSSSRLRSTGYTERENIKSRSVV